LAFTALEEISKSQFAADVYTGFVDEEEIKDFYKDHKSKIRRMLLSFDNQDSGPLDSFLVLRGRW